MTVWTNPVFRLILLGTADPQSELGRLRGNRDCLGLIFGELSKQWTAHINKTTGYSVIGDCMYDFDFPLPISGKKAVINVNMMPIIMGDSKSLPEDLQRYSRLIQLCLFASPEERGKIGYLTVHESYVEKGSCQRRPGLHTESPGKVRLGSGEYSETVFQWGEGFCVRGVVSGGIFMASNIRDSCAVWDLLIDRHEEMVGELGDIEFVRDILDGEEFRSRRNLIRANQLVWMTDRTPHESLPLMKGMFRQYFRLVTSNVTGWYEQHSTKNPLGIQPGPSVVIIPGNKFLQQCSLNDS